MFVENYFQTHKALKNNELVCIIVAGRWVLHLACVKMRAQDLAFLVFFRPMLVVKLTCLLLLVLKGTNVSFLPGALDYKTPVYA